MNTNSDDTLRIKLKIFHQLGAFIQPYRDTIVVALVVLLIAAAASLAIPYTIKQIVDSGFLIKEQADIKRYFLTLLAIVSVMSVFTALRYYLVMWLGERIVADLRLALYRTILYREPVFFESTSTGELLSRLTADTTLVQVAVGGGLSLTLRSTLELVGSLFMLTVTSLKLTLLIIAAVPLVLIPLIIYGRQVKRLSRVNQDKMAATNAIAGESLNAIPVIQAFNLEEHSFNQYRQAIAEQFGSVQQRLTKRALLWGLTLFIIFTAILAIVWVGTQLVLAGELSVGELSQFMIYAYMAANSTSSLTEIWGEIQRATGALERIFELLNLPTVTRSTTTAQTINPATAGQIAFESIFFNYPSRPDYAALNNFNLELMPGESVALVGPSGAGKTTVFQLLLRFYQPQAGKITLGDADIAQVNVQQLRDLIGIVPQETVIFATTITENIRLGKLDASVEEVQQAAKAAVADAFIQRLPNGYDTFLGEKGVRLSGGQRQRIAIARALLKNPAILLLDEATSALDTESELLVQQALTRLMKNRTTLIIAHRLSTVINADRIVVMNQGRIIAIGKHKDLLITCDLYARLAGLQFSDTELLSDAHKQA